VPAVDFTYRDVEVSPDGEVRETGDPKQFKLEKAEQIANFADYCNHCGNCDTFCPEYDGPYLMKPSFFGSREAFEAGAPHDGFFLSGSPGGFALAARMAGHLYDLRQTENGFLFSDENVTLAISHNGDIERALGEPTSVGGVPKQIVDMGLYHALVTLLRGITADGRVHAVNTRLLVERNVIPAQAGTQQ
jgi:putative selenate reductase